MATGAIPPRRQRLAIRAPTICLKFRRMFFALRNPKPSRCSAELGLDLAAMPVPAAGPVNAHQEGRHRVLNRTWQAAFAAAVIAGAAGPAAAQTQGTIKIGVLHSLSGTMAISESTLKDTVLMMVDDINKKGGLLGKKVEAVVVDPASNWPLFAEKARDLLSKEKVAAVFGCWTSVSRKSVLPVFEELNGLLFYPVQYEGEESSRNVFYTGAAPNQQAIPAVEYLMGDEGGAAKRWVLEGTDYVYPRTTNKILEAFLKSKGVVPDDIKINYTPFGHSDWQTEVAAIKSFASAGKKTAVVSTINGDANVPFYKELSNVGIKASDIPVVAFSVGEEELAGIDTKNLAGHLAAWNYFESVKNRTMMLSSSNGTTLSRTRSASPMIRWRLTTSASRCGRKRSDKPARRMSMRCARRCMTKRSRPRAGLYR